MLSNVKCMAHISTVDFLSVNKAFIKLEKEELKAEATQASLFEQLYASQAKLQQLHKQKHFLKE